MEIRAIFRGIPELKSSLADLDRRTDRATMWTVREAGRLTKRAAKRGAPVYQGKRGVTRKQARRGPSVLNPNAPVKGLLKASIGSSRRLRRYGLGTYGVNVAPRGPRAHLYSAKAEARTNFMANAQNAASAATPAIARRAWTRATRGRTV